MAAIKGSRKHIWSWARREPYAWWHLCFLVWTVQVLRLDAAPGVDWHVRMLGAVFQAVGVAAVLLDLHSAMVAYGEPAYPLRFWRWIKDFGRGSNVTIEIQPGHSVVQGQTINVTTGIGSNLTELEKLRLDVTILQKQVKAQRADIDSHHVELRNAIFELRGEIKREFLGLRRELKTSTLDSAAIMFFGSIWLMVGIFLGTVAPEILCLIRG